MNDVKSRLEDECALIAKELFRCQLENTIGKYFWKCNSLENKLHSCKKELRETKRQLSKEKSIEINRKIMEDTRR